MSYSYDFYIQTCNSLKNAGFVPKNILDIGASLGETAHIVKKIWPNSNLLLIEGNIECKPYLKNYNCIYKLLGKQDGFATFYKSRKDPFATGNSIYKEISDYYDNNNTYTEVLPIYKLDDIVNGKFDFIKIDTQGSELDIIEGGIRTFGDAKVIVVEVSLTNTNDGGCTKNQIVHKLNSLHFDMVDIIETIHNKQQITQQNLLFIRP